MNYSDNDLEGVRNTTNKQARIPHNLAGIWNRHFVSAKLEYTPQQPPPQ